MKELTTLPIYKEIQKHLNQGVLVDRVWDLPKSLLCSYLYDHHDGDMIIITSGESGSALFEDLSFFQRNLMQLPGWEVSGKHGERPSKDVMGERLNILQKCLSSKKKIIFTPITSFFQKVLSEKMIAKSKLLFEVGKDFDFDSLAETLESLGMSRVPIVNDKGEFAIRGSIIDLFPSHHKEPFRVEFFGDTIESIRTFDANSQISTGKIESILVGISDEFTLLQQDTQKRSLLSLFKNPILIFDEITHLEDKAAMQGLIKELSLVIKENHPHLFFTKENVMEISENCRVSKEKNTSFINFEIFNAKKKMAFFPLPFSDCDHYDFKEANDLIKSGFEFHLIAEKDKEQAILYQSLFKYEKPKNVHELKGYLSSGLVFEEKKIIIYPYTLLTNKKKVRRSPYRRGFGAPLSEFHELERGDLIVHLHNGIGKYEGIEKKSNHLGEEEEFIQISYAGKSKLFVPLSQSHLITRYIGPHSGEASLSTLGTSKWAMVKAKTQASITKYAKELLTTQAIRHKHGGFGFEENGELTNEFISYFPYDETVDQTNAVDAIFADMQDTDAMDRLVLGDVGFGKTEVAMRAAFKAVSDGGKQVALLVPTTILATQHYENFVERMKPFGVNIGLLSRFQKAKEIKQVKQDIASGKIDIAIGTHRIINKDVVFKDLGLLIIDEEQRFGVKAKESLKARKASIDCLTLSATPIPRTLYMSLVKVKDLSIISTPPMDRLPIQTVLAEYDEEVIAHALKREFLRDGQSFYIHNRVETIAEKAMQIQKLLPEAKIAICHGQMPSDSIDKVFHSFKAQEIDILIATTIVESGIDIPTANTIIIENAHRFGISDLYQLRGRVGRWNRSAYAYLLLPKNRVLPQETTRRLRALTESSSLGGAYKLAMVDLEIRGCGDILGTKQSGQMETIGFHLYCKMLKQAIEALKEGKAISFLDTEIIHSFPANIPTYYLPEVSLRLEIYNRLGGCLTEEEIDRLSKELIDRYGKAPLEVKWLFAIAKIKLLCNSLSISKLHFKTVTIEVTYLHMGKKEIKTMLFKPQKSPDTLTKALKISLIE
ncbi:MAG: Transcription-repair-coupling factor [Chlamydiia bacterium]|nr:Transcription-repair-coupling factor [Chlamydiia bacterium]